MENTIQNYEIALTGLKERYDFAEIDTLLLISIWWLVLFQIATLSINRCLLRVCTSSAVLLCCGMQHIPEAI